jgi:apolipoprotein N-acyltransferase
MCCLSRADRIALLTGAALGVAIVPGPQGVLVLVGLAPLLRELAAGPAPAEAVRAGFLAGLLFFGIGFGWVLLGEGGGVATWVAYLVGLPILAAGLALFAGVLAALARRSAALALAAAPGLWVGLEWVRSQEWVFAALWDHLGYALVDHPAWIQGAGWFGVYGLSFWIVALNAALVLLPRLGARARGGLVAALALPLLPGAVPLGGSPAQGELRVAAVQPDLPEAQRRDPARFAENLGLLVDLSRVGLERPADLVVWPESAYQRAQGDAGDAFLAAIAHALGAPLVTGVWRAPGPGRDGWRNAAVLATPGGSVAAVAEKVHPVPVYERAPDGPVARTLARLGLWSGRFEPGRPTPPVALASGAGEPVPVGVLVCVDASHPDLARDLRAAGARLLVAIANEAASGPWSAELHARVTRMRAIENGVPVVRVANTGPTLWIDARGRVVASFARGERRAAVHALAAAGAPPPFVRVGDARIVALAAASACAAALAALARSPAFRRRAPSYGTWELRRMSRAGEPEC